MARWGGVRSICVLLLLSPCWLAAQATRVPIDVAPGNETTEIESGRGGLLPVAVLSTAAFDATTVDPATIRVGATGTEAEPARTVTEDVNGDGRLDVMSLVRVTELQLPCGATDVRLTAETKAGDAVEGSERVTVVGCSSN